MASKFAGQGARLGLVASTAEQTASLSPLDYIYGVPTEEQRQRFLRHAVSSSGARSPKAAVAPTSSDAFGTGPAALQGAVPASPAAAAAASVDELFNTHLALDLDEDCLKLLLLGEEAAESGPCASGANSGGAHCGLAGSGSGGSEKSSATADHGSPRGDAGAEAEALSLPCAKQQQQRAEEEEEDVAMLFANHEEHRGPVGLEALDLQLLGAAHAAGTGAAGAADDFDCDTTSGATGSISKRAKQSGGWEAGSPSASGRGGGVGAGASGGGGLMLSMDYERAAESINLELLAAGRKPLAGSHEHGLGSMLSPLCYLTQVHTPHSPDSLASGCDVLAAQLPSGLQRQDSSSKRKRAASVRAA